MGSCGSSSGGTQALVHVPRVPAQGPRGCGARALIAPQNMSTWTRDRARSSAGAGRFLSPVPAGKFPKAVVLNSNFALYSPKVLHKNRDEYEPHSTQMLIQLSWVWVKAVVMVTAWAPLVQPVLQLCGFYSTLLSQVGATDCRPPGEANFPLTPFSVSYQEGECWGHYVRVFKDCWLQWKVSTV